MSYIAKQGVSMKKICLLAAMAVSVATAYGACGARNYQAAQTGSSYDQSTVTYDRGDVRTQANQGAPSDTRYTTPPNISSDDRMMPAGDDQMTSAIRNFIQNSDISVSVNQGVVTLKGTVTSEEIKQGLENRISQLPGVKRVDNQLQVAPKAN